jgi:hypothetical protein
MEVMAAFKARADEFDAKLKDVPAAMVADKAAAEKKVADLKAANGPVAEIQAAEKALAGLPKDEADAKKAWTARPRPTNEGRAKPLGGMPSHAASSRATRTATPRPRRPSTKVASQLPGPDVLPDGGHGRAAAHPDALLHHAFGEGGA